MNSKTLKIIALAVIWCASSGAAYWIGLKNAPVPAPKVVYGKSTKNSSDHGEFVNIGNGQGKQVLSLQDLLNSKGKLDPDDLKAWADSLDPAACAGLLAELQKLPDGEKRDALIAAMIASWAGRDPASYLTAHNDVTNPRTRESGVADALKAMAAKDPKAAIAWLNDSSDAVPNQLLARRYRSTIDGIASSDPQSALDFVNSLNANTTVNQQIRRQGLTTIADSMAASGNFTGALQMFSSLQGADANTASAELMNRWADSSPKDATTYIATMTDPAQRSQAAGEVAQTWARNDPQAAAAWAAQFDQSMTDSTGQPSGQTLADAVRSWSRYDLNGPATFLNTLTPSAATDPAVVTFTMQARNSDPSDAMIWAGQITDPNVRQRVTGSVAVGWLASGDTDGFNQYMASSANTLTDQQKQFLSNLPTNNPQLLNRISRRMGANIINNPNGGAPGQRGGGPQGGGGFQFGGRGGPAGGGGGG